MIELLDDTDVKDSAEDDDSIHFIIGSTSYENGIWHGGRRICDGQPSIAWMTSYSLEEGLAQVTCETCRLKMRSYYSF